MQIGKMRRINLTDEVIKRSEEVTIWFLTQVQLC